MSWLTSWGFQDRKKIDSEDYPQTSGFMRVKVKFISSDGLSREDTISSIDGIMPKNLERRMYLQDSSPGKSDINKLINDWNNAGIRKYRYSHKEDSTGAYIYMEVGEENNVSKEDAK